ncbi:MAG TPA: GTP-binding protein [Candidatus Deferrimicrobium sp.]|nr:GTP-binding protein [Candidatus Deferrimicrobium sp.]
MSNVRFRFKLVLVGEGAVGKTSIREKYMGRGFTGEYLKTIGADFASKVVELKDASGENIKSIFQIWDLAGQQEFSAVRASFYGGCQGILLVYDMTRKDTMDKLKDWILEAAKNAGGTIKGFYLIGNKCDLPEREVTAEDGKDFSTFLANRLKFPMPYIETSAKTGQNIEYLFKDLCRTLLLKEGLDIPEISKEGEQAAPAEKKPKPSPAPAVPVAPKAPEVPEVAEAPEIPEVPEIPAPSAASAAGGELDERVAKLEKRVTEIEDLLKKIAQLLQGKLK